MVAANLRDTSDEELFANPHPELMVTTRILCEEERNMEIPSAFTVDTWRKRNNVQDSDVIQAPEGLEERDSRKGDTQTSTASRQPSPSKKHSEFYGFSPQIHVEILRLVNVLRIIIQIELLEDIDGQHDGKGKPRHERRDYPIISSHCHINIAEHDSTQLFPDRDDPDQDPNRNPPYLGSGHLGLFRC